MSVSKWNYSPEKCDGDYCCGDCDLCEIGPVYLTPSDIVFCSECDKFPCNLIKENGWKLRGSGCTVRVYQQTEKAERKEADDDS